MTGTCLCTHDSNGHDRVNHACTAEDCECYGFVAVREDRDRDDGLREDREEG